MSRNVAKGVVFVGTLISLILIFLSSYIGFAAASLAVIPFSFLVGWAIRELIWGDRK